MSAFLLWAEASRPWPLSLAGEVGLILRVTGSHQRVPGRGQQDTTHVLGCFSGSLSPGLVGPGSVTCGAVSPRTSPGSLVDTSRLYRATQVEQLGSSHPLFLPLKRAGGKPPLRSTPGPSDREAVLGVRARLCQVASRCPRLSLRVQLCRSLPDAAPSFLPAPGLAAPS